MNNRWLQMEMEQMEKFSPQNLSDNTLNNNNSLQSFENLEKRLNPSRQMLNTSSSYSIAEMTPPIAHSTPTDDFPPGSSVSTQSTTLSFSKHKLKQLPSKQFEALIPNFKQPSLPPYKNQHPITPGGHHFPPIPEVPQHEEQEQQLNESIQTPSEQLRRLVGRAKDQFGTQKKQSLDNTRIAQALINQLRALIMQWDWAQATHRNLQKQYEEQLQENFKALWTKLAEEKKEFEQDKQKEYRKLAAIRSSLRNDQIKSNSRKDAERNKELDNELKKSRAKELNGTRKIAELNTKIQILQGQLKASEEYYEELKNKFKELENQNIKTNSTIAGLRNTITQMKQQQLEQQPLEAVFQQQPQRVQHLPGPRATLFNIQQRQQQQNGVRIESTSSSLGTAGTSTVSMGSTAFQATGRNIRRNNSDSTTLPIQHTAPRILRSNSENGTQTAAIQQHRVRFALDGQQQQSPNQQEEQYIQGALVTELRCQHSSRQCLLYENSEAVEKDFRWISRPRSSNNRHMQIQIDYVQDNCYTVRTQIGNIIRFILSGQLEIGWHNGDTTTVFRNGDRHETFRSNRLDFCREIYQSGGSAYRLTSAGREDFTPNRNRMSERPDMYGYAELHSSDGTKPECLQISGQDFSLFRYDDTTGVTMKIKLYEPHYDGATEVWLCTDNMLQIKHVVKVTAAGSPNKVPVKYLCLMRGQCAHVMS